MRRGAARWRLRQTAARRTACPRACRTPTAARGEIPVLLARLGRRVVGPFALRGRRGRGRILHGDSRGGGVEARGDELGRVLLDVGAHCARELALVCLLAVDGGLFYDPWSGAE